jgi:hypothetical protein
MIKVGVFWIVMVTGLFWSIGMTPAGFLRNMKQSNIEEIRQQNVESTANKREKFKSLRNNLKHFLTKSKNGVKVDKTGGISFKALLYELELKGENKKWEKTMSEKVENRNIKFGLVVRKVSARAKEDLKELEEMRKN